MKLYPLFLAISLIFCTNLEAQKNIQHFVFFNIDRDRIQEQSFLEAENVAGAQLKYTWKELEPTKGNYDFENIQKDLDYLKGLGKKLFIQIQDVTFDTARVNVPGYIMELPEYHGGVAIQYLTDDKENIISQDGYVPRRWDPKVAERFHRLISELGKHFDGKIEGINFPETAVGFGDSGKLYPEGFTPEIYRDAILKQMKAGKQAFPNSVVLQYANFMPGEWLPWEDKGYLESLYQYAKENDIGMGGPDIKIYKRAQMNHSYKFLKAFSDNITTGVAVQWGNYEETNPKTGKQVSVEEIHTFGKEEVGLDYIFWSTQEPYYSEQLLPYLEKEATLSSARVYSDLYQALFSQDSLLFNVGFNQCDITVFERLVSENFEFYHDQSGVTSSKAAFVEGTKNGLCKLDYQPLRTLVKGSLEAFPLYNNGVLYGAIQNGEHRFYAKYSGQEPRLTSVAKFTHVWLLEEGEWRLTRVLSYDHH